MASTPRDAVHVETFNRSPVRAPSRGRGSKALELSLLTTERRVEKFAKEKRVNKKAGKIRHER